MGPDNLRLATSDDTAALARLGRDSFVAKFGHIYAPEDLSAFLDQVYSESAIAAEMARDGIVCCLAETDGKLTAWCKLSLDCGWPEHARGQRAIELKQLYTDPALTGRGIGALLMEWAFDEARKHGADEIQLSVFSENFGAQRFYARYGFAKVADTTFRVGNHIDKEFVFARML
ncbi:MAG: N-acetyltransferase family protein [Novosphingobium sp.]